MNFCLVKRYVFHRFYVTFQQKTNNVYKNTLCLPQTKFSLWPLKGCFDSKEFEILTQKLYQWQKTYLPPEKIFILHDGPPYANGSLHLGHALNKILKDVILRVNIMKGRPVSYIPGWDCHGLPIELKALEDNEQFTFHKSPMTIRKKAREYALETIKHQKESFKSFGIMADWEKSYHTLDVSYIIWQLDIFKKMVEKDLIYRSYKPVYWSPSSRTALADAELIYKNDHISQAVFVRFPLVNLGKLSSIINVKNKEPLYILIWTTTPWTLPANKAIFLDKDMEYTIVNTVQYGNLILSRNRVPHLLKFINISETFLYFFGEALLEATYHNPLEDDFKEMPFFHTKYVTSDSGTGLVHAAPGHGMEDYEVCIQHNIPIFSPVDDHGCFTKEALDGKLEFLFVLEDGNKKVIELLENQKMLVSLEKYIHKYPYDWRTKKPVIQRATAQWFVDIEKIKSTTIKALKNVKMIPGNGKERLISFLRSRSEWCISRQRAWGVPIPVLYSLENEKPLLTVENIDHIINRVKKHGMDAWWEDSDSDIWVAPEYKKNGIRYKKGMETMDVWFDSGVSWNVILNDSNYNNLDSRKDKPLIDLVLEGSDQHRGWFQSLLLTFVASQNDHSNIAPYGTVITHGYVLDQCNQKMSKSIGNVINPENIIFGEKVIENGPAYGVDVLRLWAVGNNFTNDINISSLILKNVAELQRKLRATLRFLLGNLYDWDGNKVEYKSLRKIDQYALAQTYDFNRKTIELYDKFLFFQVVHAVANYTNNQLSSFYFDIIKDRLYADHRTSKSRTSCQTVLFHIFRNYISIISPIVPSLALEAWKFSRKEVIGEIETPFHSGWYKCEEEWLNLELKKEFQNIEMIRSASNLILERARKNKYIRSPLECVIIIKAPLKTEAYNFLKKIEHELSEILIVSGVSVISMDSELFNQKWNDYQEITLFGSICHLVLKLSEKKKCLRCWMYTVNMNSDICHRCTEVVLNN